MAKIKRKRIPRPRPRTPELSRASSDESRQAGAREIALLAAKAGLDKKAAGVQIIDVGGKVDYADFLVLMTGRSDRHVASIAQGVDAALSEAGTPALSMEGMTRGEWVLIDFVDVVVHVFQEETRALYDLDGLWMDAERLDLPEEQEES